jgi:hypothetical protein
MKEVTMSKEKLSQTGLIATYLQSHGVFSDRQAIQFGIANLRARVDELRQRGWKIVRAKTTRGGGCYQIVN